MPLSWQMIEAARYFTGTKWLAFKGEEPTVLRCMFNAGVLEDLETVQVGTFLCPFGKGTSFVEVFRAVERAGADAQWFDNDPSEC